MAKKYKQIHFPCRHDEDVLDGEIIVPDYHPLSKRQIRNLLRHARQNPQERNSILLRFWQGMIGAVCPYPVSGERFEKQQAIRRLYEGSKYTSPSKTLVNSLYRIMHSSYEEVMPGQEEVKKEITEDDFHQLAKIIAAFSGGKIRIAFREDDDSTEKNKEVAHFLKLNGKRIARDIQVHGFMARVNPEKALPSFLEEVLIPIKKECPESYKKAAVQLKELGLLVYAGSILDDWNGLF